MSPKKAAERQPPPPKAAPAEHLLTQTKGMTLGHVHLTRSRSGVESYVPEVVERDQRRKYDTTIVRCRCGQRHVHRGFGLRTAPCGRRYRLVAAVEAVA